MKTDKKKYICPNCGWTSSENSAGEGRYHCVNCLSGIHSAEDETTECGGILEPVGIWVKTDDSWEIVQRCRTCGKMMTVPMSEKDNRLKILSIAFRPLSSPPFPIERTRELTEIIEKGEYNNESRE